MPINLSQFTSQAGTLNLLGPEWSVLVLASGACMFSSQWKSNKEMKVMLPSQSMIMSWRQNNQPVNVIGFNIENINWK